MLDKIKQFFEAQFRPDRPLENMADNLHLAAAALMIEVATIDDNFDTLELRTLAGLLQQQFDLTEEQIEPLIEMARLEHHNATSLYQFTQLVNSECSALEKYRLITNMWRIAFADREIDKYEEYIIRRVADLIHVSQGDFIRAKREARDS